MIFGQTGARTFGSQLNIIFCLLYNSTRLSGLSEAKLVFFSYIPFNISHSGTLSPSFDASLGTHRVDIVHSFVCFTALIYILLHDTHTKDFVGPQANSQQNSAHNTIFRGEI